MKNMILSVLIFSASPVFAEGAPSMDLPRMTETSHLTCAQVQAVVKKQGMAWLSTGQEFGAYSFTDCNGFPAGFVCTLDEVYCAVGSYCETVPGLSPPGTFLQGTEFCPARKNR